MDRRHFIKISGVSFASLLIQLPAFAGESPKHLIQLPDSIMIQSGNKLYSLRSSDKSTWGFEDVEVVLKEVNDALVVSVRSGTIPLSNVQLKWKQSFSNQSKYLGDHWERTYGDVSWKTTISGKKMPWYFIQHGGSVSRCFGVKTGCNSICYWNVAPTEVTLTMDTRSGGDGVMLADRTLHAAEIITTVSTAGENSFATGRRFCKLMCEKPRLAKLPVYGINDWYFAYGNNSTASIMEHTNLLAPLATDTINRPFSVIDAGWAKYSPLLPKDCCWQDDFSLPNEHFKDMAKLADDIKATGMRPGLWTRPLCGAHDDAKNRMLPSIIGRNDPKKPVLDPTIDENIARIKKNISTYKGWGFELVKHDFSTYDLLGKWGFEMADSITMSGWRCYDNSKTNAEIILNLYQAIREAAGNMYLIGCNTISHLSAGLFEINRIGDDTSGLDWARTRKMGVNALAFRSIHHNNFYAADADCVGLTNKVSWNKNKQWLQLLAESGTPLFISAQPDATGSAQRILIKESFSKAAVVQPLGEPIDWMQTITPNKWKLNNRMVNFNWS